MENQPGSMILRYNLSVYHDSIFYLPVDCSALQWFFLMVIMQVQTKKVTKLCNSKDIVTINGMFPGPVVYAQEDDRIIVKVTNETPSNVTIHW